MRNSQLTITTRSSGIVNFHGYTLNDSQLTITTCISQVSSLQKLVGSSVPLEDSSSLLEPLLRDKSKVNTHVHPHYILYVHTVAHTPMDRVSGVSYVGLCV